MLATRSSARSSGRPTARSSGPTRSSGACWASPACGSPPRRGEWPPNAPPGEWAHERLSVSSDGSDDVFDLAIRIRTGTGPALVDRATVIATVGAMDEMIAAIV